MNVLEILFGAILATVVLLFYNSNPGHPALKEVPILSISAP